MTTPTTVNLDKLRNAVQQFGAMSFTTSQVAMDYHQGESRWEGDIPCRNVPAGKAEQKQFEDGAVRTYSATIRLDAECREFTVGDRVKLFLSGDIVRECEVKGFHRYQLYAKLWV